MLRPGCRAGMPAIALALAFGVAGLALGRSAKADGREAQDTVAEREITALILAIGDSRCRFQRNGRWHDAGQARAHLQRKYDLARRRGLRGDAEDFITRAASRSSLTGRDYRVDCAGREEAAAAWFSRELARLRAADSSRTPR